MWPVLIGSTTEAHAVKVGLAAFAGGVAPSASLQRAVYGAQWPRVVACLGNWAIPLRLYYRGGRLPIRVVILLPSECLELSLQTKGS